MVVRTYEKGFTDSGRESKRYTGSSQSLHEWNRKAWSHMNFIIALDLKLDPGNVVRFLALRFLARQMLRLGTPAQEDWIRKLHRFIAPIRGDVLADMQAGKRIDLTNDGGDVLEAVGGIVHPWASESEMFVEEKLEEWGLEKRDV